MRDPWNILPVDFSRFILDMMIPPMFQGVEYLFLGFSLLVCLAGVILLVLLARRPREQPRCRKCRFDMRGSSSLVCSECGWQARDQRALHSNNRMLWWLVPVLLACLAWPGYKAVNWSKERGWTPPLPRYKITTVKTFSTGHVVELCTCRNPRDWSGPSFLRLINAEGEILWGGSGSNATGDRATLHAHLPEDITGDGRPNLVVESCTSGTGRYASCTILHFDEDGVFDTWVLGGYCGASFVDFDGDGVFEATMSDGTLKYELACGACLPLPSVILRVQESTGDTWTLALECMRKPPPDPQTLDVMVEELRALDWSKPIDPEGMFPYANSTVDQLWEAMLPLVYSGNGSTAIELHQRVWPKNVPYNEETLEHFLRIVGGWSDIVDLQDPPIQWPDP